jgi:hypothetical protein
VVGINVARAFAEFHAAPPPASAAGGHFAIAHWLTAIRGTTPVAHIAARAGCSRFAMARWLSAAAQPRLPDFSAASMRSPAVCRISSQRSLLRWRVILCYHGSIMRKREGVRKDQHLAESKRFGFAEKACQAPLRWQRFGGHVGACRRRGIARGDA